MKKKFVRPESLSDWQKIFKEHDNKLYDASYLLLRVVEKMSKMAKAWRKDDLSKLIETIPEVFYRLMAFYARLDINIEEVLWSKYPGICPYCFKRENCICSTLDSKGEYNPDNPKYVPFRKDKKEMPKSLKEWQTMLKRIYGDANRPESSNCLWLHIMEEIGEISEALGRNERKNLEEECADALAWLLPFCTKLEVDLDELAWNRYPRECDVCHKQKCECEYF